tara:strand:- start:444 stop:740 length:297 start_codon:yes stop_codon:yes gene_type:complete
LKIKIALFFTFLFVGLISAPTIITLVDENQDISIFLNLSEEEEESHGKQAIKEIKVYPTTDLIVFFRKIQKKKNVRFTSKNYISLYPKILTPPPESVL